MRVFVCIKRVPNVSEVEIKLNAAGKDVDLGRSPMEINEADNCAVEQAILIKEATGGSVRTVTIGPKEDDVMIRMALAKGCDSAIRIDDHQVDPKANPLTLAKVLAAAIIGQEFDLVLTGAMAADYGHTAVGVALAEELGVPHVAMVKKVDLENGKVRAVRELEGGLGEVVEIALPAVLTIQTGINKPRYAPILGIKAAQKKELKLLNLNDLGLNVDEVYAVDSLVKFERYYFPNIVSKAEIIEGDPDVKAEILANKIVRGGVL